ncbi:serine hydrolase [Clostridium sp. DL1XJH146]
MKKSILNFNVPLIILIILVIMVNIFSVIAIAGENYEEYELDEKNLVKKLMEQNREFYGKYIDGQDKYQIQILYTAIDRNDEEKTKFTSHYYNVDPEKYFYPASSVKLSSCLLALEKLNNLGIEGVNKYTDLMIKKGRSSQSEDTKDWTTESRLPSIASYIRKILVVSDNNSFDRLYEFLGQKYYNETLWQKGYDNALVIHRLGNAVGYEENRYTNPIYFYKDGKLILNQEMQYNNEAYLNRNLKNLQIGKGYYSGGKLISSPKNFSKSNYMSVECLQNLLLAVFFPEDIDENKRFNLESDDYLFLKEYLSTLPSKCDAPKYEYKDSYVKYFMYGDTDEKIPENIKIYNKIGCAYGFLIDNAYIVDEEKGVDFLLTAVIYCNNNDILNDGKYNYYDEGMPFLANLGRTIYNYEVNQRCVDNSIKKNNYS